MFCKGLGFRVEGLGFKFRVTLLRFTRMGCEALSPEPIQERAFFEGFLCLIAHAGYRMVLGFRVQRV